MRAPGSVQDARAAFSVCVWPGTAGTVQKRPLLHYPPLKTTSHMFTKRDATIVSPPILVSVSGLKMTRFAWAVGSCNALKSGVPLGVQVPSPAGDGTLLGM